MAIVENRSTEVGDVILINSQIPIVGIIALNSFLDITVGETGVRYFNKEFRYSLDGVNFNVEGWLPLTNPNIDAIQVEATSVFIVEYRYERVGTDDTGYIAFEEVRLQGEYEPPPIGYVYENSIFAQFFDPYNLCSLTWAINVLEKMFQSGSMAKYIERKRTDNPLEDKDFGDFWMSVTTFFAYIVCFAREFQSFTSNETMLREYLTQKDLVFCVNDTQQDLGILANNYFGEMAKRGTFGIFFQKTQVGEVNGELLRLFCKTLCDELIFALQKPQHVGWNVGNCCPTSPQVNDQRYNNKSWSDQADIEDLTPYPVINAPLVSLVTDGSREVMAVDATAAETNAGIGVDANNFPTGLDFDKAIVVSAYLDYQFTFQIKQPNQALEVISFGILGLDSANNPVQMTNIVTGTLTSYFFKQQKLNKVGQWYYIQGVLFNKDTPIMSADDGRLNIGFGENLRFSTEQVCRVLPFVLTDTPLGFVGDGSILVWDIKFRPLKTEYTTGFVNVSNFIHNWSVSRNIKLSEQEQDYFIRQKLIPYNTLFRSQYLPPVEFGEVITPFTIFVVSKQNVSVNGGSDGSITIGWSGGVLPIAWLWSSGQTTKDIIGIPAGLYTITATDDAAAVAQLIDIEITEPGTPPNIVVIDVTQPTVALNDGSITIRVDDGAPAFAVVWSNGVLDSLADNIQTSTISGLAPGAYSVQITDNDSVIDVENFNLIAPTNTMYIVRDKDIYLGNLTDPWTLATIALLPLQDFREVKLGASSQKGVAVLSGQSWVTDDDGLTWAPEPNPKYAGSFTKATKIGDAIVTVANQYVYVQSFALWPNWTVSTLPSNPSAEAIYGQEEVGGISLIGGIQTYKSFDYGNTWTNFSISSPVAGPQPKIYAVHMVTNSVGYLGGVNCVFRTLDSGLSWQDIMGENAPPVQPLNFPQFDTIYAFDSLESTPGNYITLAGGVLQTLYKTETGVGGINEGDLWIALPSVGLPSQTIRKIGMLSLTRIWVLMNDAIYESLDGGNTFALYAATGLTNSNIDDFYIKARNH